MEIVGVTKNARYGSLKNDIQPVVYLPFNQGVPLPNDEMMFALRTAGGKSFIKPIRTCRFRMCTHNSRKSTIKCAKKQSWRNSAPPSRSWR